jgi:hypothetical protein
MLNFVLCKVSLPNRLNFIPWMNAVTPTPYRTMNVRNWSKKPLVKLKMKVTWRSRQITFIHGTELVWPCKVMVRSWCDRVKSWYGVDVTARIHGNVDAIWYAAGVIHKVIPCGFCVHCTVGIHLVDFMFFVHSEWRDPPFFVILFGYMTKNHTLPSLSMSGRLPLRALPLFSICVVGSKLFKSPQICQISCVRTRPCLMTWKTGTSLSKDDKYQSPPNSLNALTDHFEGGSRLYSFDLYW